MTQGVKANTCSNPADAPVRGETIDSRSGLHVITWGSGGDVCAQINQNNQVGIPFVINGPEPIFRTTTPTTTTTSTPTTTTTSTTTPTTTTTTSTTTTTPTTTTTTPTTEGRRA